MRRELVLRGVEIDAVEHEVEVAVVRLDLRMEDFAERVFDRELVEAEVVREDAALLFRGVLEVDPQLDAAARLEPGRIELVTCRVSRSRERRSSAWRGGRDRRRNPSARHSVIRPASRRP